ncbi:MAG: hypothetical protein ACO1OQ_00535 [Rufibacter sp.]
MTPGKIFLADQRGLFETPNLRRFSTFNFGDFYHAFKTPFHGLIALNEEELAPGHRVVLDVEQASHVVLIPITGDVSFTGEPGHFCQVQVGQALVATLPENSTFQLANPYPGDGIGYLQIWINANDAVNTAQTFLFDFDEDSLTNQLTTIIPFNAAEVLLPFSISLGRLAGRQEAVLELQSAQSTAFVFVVSGAFEVEERLLHAKDGLALWDLEKLEMEALSQNALLLAIELHQ